jgi:serine/threonine-protein kinase
MINEYQDRTMPSPDISKRPAQANDPLVGSLLSDRYEIISLLGEGDFGRVYKSRQTQINRTVAIKTLKRELLRGSFQSELFASNAGPIVQLSHPNIVAIYECGLTPAAEPYFAMDLLNGETLRQLIDAEAPLPPSRVAAIASQIADALAYAHETGVVHGDLKPVNAIISESESQNDVVKLVDFDIGKFVRRPEEDLDSQDPRANVLESAHYMSPERCKGEPMDARTDVYSLGCMMREMLVGHPPFGGDTVEGTIKAHINQTPQPFFAILENTPLACDLEYITIKALSKEPEDRYQSASEMLEDLNHAIKGEGVGADRQMAQKKRQPLSQAMWMQVILSVMLLSTLSGIVVLVTAVAR